MNKKINITGWIIAMDNINFDAIFTELLIKTRKKLTLSLIILNVPFFSFAQTWEYKGLGTQVIRSIYTKNDTIYAGTTSIHRSIDLGSSWDTIASSGYYGITSIISHKETLFFGTHRQGLFRSMDNGISWEQKDNGLPATFAIDVLIIGDNDHLIAAGNSFDNTPTDCTCIFESNDDGENWSSISSGLHVETSIYDIKINNSGYIFAYGWSDGYYKIWRSTDNAATWEQLPNPPTASPYSLDLDSLGNLFVGSGSTIYLSSDNGNNWSSLFTFPENVSKIKLNKKTGVIYTVTRDSANHLSAYHSEDNGNSWTDISNGLPDISSFEIPIEFDLSGNVYMGTSTGIYKLNILNTALPKTANTEQFNIYPNPFSDQFSIDGLAGENTTINIYNLTGQKIYSAYVVGSSTTIDLSPFNNGIYLLQLITPEKTVLKKIIKE